MYITKKKSKGCTRIILTITVILFIFWSCCVLGAQINREMFVQFGPDGCTINLRHCLGIFIVYGVCFTPMILYWIKEGFREDGNNRFV